MPKIEIVTQPSALALIGVPHSGTHRGIGEAFQRMSDQLTAQALWPQSGAWVALYHNDQTQVSEDALRSHAACVFASDAPLPDGFERVSLPAGRYAEVIHTGPYTGLSTTWQWFRQAGLSEAGLRQADGPSAEFYPTDPKTTAPEDLQTRLLIPIV